jgi:hypothetical protein
MAMKTGERAYNKEWRKREVQKKTGLVGQDKIYLGMGGWCEVRIGQAGER